MTIECNVSEANGNDSGQIAKFSGNVLEKMANGKILGHIAKF